MNIKFLLIGDLTGRRIKHFTDCLKAFNIHNVKVISWIEILNDLSILEKNLKENTIVKLEPPEKDMEIYREFLLKGEDKGLVSKDEINKIDFSNYPIVAPAQWYEGFKVVLENMKKIYNHHLNKNIFFMNDFEDTLNMMDKSKTYDILACNLKNSEFYLPKRLENPKDCKEFREIYGNQFIKCFIKLRYGSGSTGILAYSNNPKIKEEKVFTSLNVRNIDDKKVFFGNYKVNCFKEKEVIEELMNWVLYNGAHIEKWIAKSTYEGFSFDTRSFVINKKSAYLISRLSKTPITNLHLKNHREESEKILSPNNFKVVSRASEDVMKIFNKSMYAGIDVVTSNSYKPYIIDVNPFGDLFHNLVGKKENIYYLEIKKAIEILRGGING